MTKPLWMNFSLPYDLIFPNLCVGCHVHKPIKGGAFCISCKEQISPTYQMKNWSLGHDNPEFDNEFIKRFYGRVSIYQAAALFWYSKGDVVEDMIYNLKYKGQKHIGKILGHQLGEEMVKYSCFAEIDYIIPIPIHDIKKQKRGFNQSDIIANAVSQVIHIPLAPNCLYKKKHTISQTHKSRIQRLASIVDNFGIKNMDILRGKRVLLLDDVLTTGATLEAAARILINEVNVFNVSMVTIGMGKLH